MMNFLENNKKGNCMKLLVLHISDLHIEDVIEDKDKKIKSISKILDNKYSEYKHILIVFSGDISKTGKRSEYEYAYSFISELENNISDDKTVKISLCPGNHDRLFKVGEKRDLEYINSISKSNYEIEVENNLYLNENYFDFEKKICPNYKSVNTVLKYYDYQIGEEKVRVYSLNNALLSFFDMHHKGEDLNRGKIFIRNQFLDISRGNSDYVFLLMHMPFNYLRNECLNYIKTNLSNKIDAIFTGHIHKEQFEKTIDEESELLEFTSSAIDCDNMSAFSVVLFDDEKVQTDYYSFRDDKYIFKFSSSTNLRRKFSTSFGQLIANDRVRELRNMEVFDGVNNLFVPIEKLFVFPKLSHKKYSNQESITTFERFESTRATKGVTKILGDVHSGKSQFAKFLFEEYRKKGYLPLICKGDDLGTNLESSVARQLKQLYSEKNDVDSFYGVSKEKRILIIDNLIKGSRILFRNALKIFGSIVYTTLSSKDFISSEEDDGEYDFEVFEIEPFFYDKRAKLYEKIFQYVKDTNPSLIDNQDINIFSQNIEQKLKEFDADNMMDPSNIIYVSLSYLKKANYQISPSNSLFQTKLKVMLERALREGGYKYCDCDVAEDIIASVAMDAYIKQINKIDKYIFEQAIKERMNEYGGRAPIKNVDSFIEMLIQIEILKRNEKDELTFYNRKTFAHYVSKFAMYKKNNYGDETYLKRIVENGIYKPINLQILFSIATNYEYRTIPEFFIKELYDGIMKEPEMRFDSFDSFFKALDNNDEDFKALEISKKKRNEIREKQGLEEEKNRKIHLNHKDDYFYYDISKTTFLRLDDLLNKALIISSIMNNFSSVLRKEAKSQLAEMLIKIPYAIINIYLADAIKKLDIIFVRVYDQLSRIPQTKVTYQFVKQSIASEIHATILTIFDICTRFVRNPIIIESICNQLSLNKDNVHLTQKLMLLSFSMDRTEFVNEVKKCFETEKDKFVLRSATLIGRRFCLDNYEWVQKNSGELLHLITNGNARAQNLIRSKSKIKK